MNANRLAIGSWLGRRIALLLVCTFGRSPLLLGYASTGAVFGFIFLAALLGIGVLVIMAR